MSWLDIVEFVAGLAIMAGSFWWLATAKERHADAQNNNPDSRSIPAAGSGSQFGPRFDPYISAGSVMYMPAGDGLYLTRHKKSRNRRYQKDLFRWLDRGAEIHIIITRSSPEAVAYWRNIKLQSKSNLHVHVLDRTRVSGEQASQTRTAIERLDTYHAVVLINPPGTPYYPGAMWLEACHALGSKYAYGIEIVLPPDAATDSRLPQYEEFYENLLSGTHATELTGKQVSRSEQTGQSLVA